tara:strand:+ start:734 stop:1150 length:417 start_codon:yes stop_codon:yes gene_type:complete
MGRPKGSRNKPKHMAVVEQDEEQRRKERLEAGYTTVLDRMFGGLQPIDYGIKHLTTSEQLKLFIELRDKEMNEPNDLKYAEWDLENIEQGFRSLERHLHKAMSDSAENFQGIIDMAFDAEQLIRRARHEFKKIGSNNG